MFKYKLGLAKTQNGFTNVNIFPIDISNKDSKIQEIANRYLYEFLVKKAYIKDIEGSTKQDREFSLGIRYELNIKLDSSKFELLINDLNKINNEGLKELEEYFAFINKNIIKNAQSKEELDIQIKNKNFTVQKINHLGVDSSLITDNTSTFYGKYEVDFNIY